MMERVIMLLKAIMNIMLSIIITELIHNRSSLLEKEIRLLPDIMQVLKAVQEAITISPEICREERNLYVKRA